MDRKRDQTFENYVVDKSNRLAFKAAVAIAEHPGQRYNPLFIYGLNGTGKTHLLQAVYNRITDRTPSANVGAFAAEELAQELVNATLAGASLFSELQRMDVLLIDDLHTLKNKTQTQIELFKVIRAFAESGRQVMMTTACSLKGLVEYDSRINCLDGTLLLDIQPLETEACAIVTKEKAAQFNLPLSEESILCIANHANGDVRRIGWIMTRLKAETELSDSAVDLSTVAGICITILQML